VLERKERTVRWQVIFLALLHPCPIRTGGRRRGARGYRRGLRWGAVKARGNISSKLNLKKGETLVHKNKT
jgi:hypothetical protein